MAYKCGWLIDKKKLTPIYTSLYNRIINQIKTRNSKSNWLQHYFPSLELYAKRKQTFSLPLTHQPFPAYSIISRTVLTWEALSLCLQSVLENYSSSTPLSAPPVFMLLLKSKKKKKKKTAAIGLIALQYNFYMTYNVGD